MHYRFRNLFIMFFRLLIGALLAYIFFCTSAGEAFAKSLYSHFRFGHITWMADPDQANTARITYIAGFRRDGLPCANPLTGVSRPCSSDPNVNDSFAKVGDTVYESVGGTSITNFGDGGNTPTLYFKVFAINKQENWVMGRALQPGTQTEYLTHHYLGAGPYTVVSSSCCRLATGHNNNPNQPYQVTAVINFNQAQASPVSLLPPIINCYVGTPCQFVLPLADQDSANPEFPDLTVRLATPGEMGGAALRQPLGTTDPLRTTFMDSNGIAHTLFKYNWDTTQAIFDPARTLYSTQVVFEKPGSTGVVFNRSAMDFFLRLNQAPAVVTSDGIKVPVRWCTLQGSPSAGSNLDATLNSRLQTLSDVIYGPQARMTFIPGALSGSYPVFQGPDLNGQPNTQGLLPNAWVDAANADMALQRAFNQCRLAWRDRNPAVTGLVVLNVNRFIDLSTGDPVDNGLFPMLGLTIIPAPNDVGQQMLGGATSIIDRVYLTNASNPNPQWPVAASLRPDPEEKFLAHELGHALTLVHPCPGSFSECGSLQPDNLMNAELKGIPLGGTTPVLADRLVQSQITRIRTQADLYIPDREIDPTLPARGSTWPDALDDVPAADRFVDLDTMGAALNQVGSTTHMFVSTFGTFPADSAGLDYFFAADLDNDPGTGGQPSALGIPYNGAGFEMVGSIHVVTNNGVAQSTPILWQFQNGQFAQVSDPNLQARVDMLKASPVSPGQTAQELSVPMGQIVQLVLPSGLHGPVASDIRLAAISHNPASGAVDIVDGSISFVAPTFPACQVTPSGAFLGAPVRVTAQGLPSNQAMEIFLGNTSLGTGASDGGGNVSVDVNLPADTRAGTRVVSVNAVGSAPAASCFVQVQALPAFDTPPTPPGGSVLNVNAGQLLTFTVQASSRNPGKTVSLQAVGLPVGAAFQTGAPANPVQGSFSWTPTLAQAGNYLVLFTAADNDGFSSPPLALSIHVRDDFTPPVLTLNVTPGSLWPPNHKLVRLTVDVSASDDNDPAPLVRLVSVTSNEADDAPGAGDGNTTGDILVDGASIWVRAERDGNGAGRIYTITYESIDSAGNRSTATALVRVPHDQGH